MNSRKRSVKTNWADLRTTDAEEAKVPAMLFVLCKTVMEDESGALFLNGTLVQRILWEGRPPHKAGCFPIDFKGPLAGGELQERRTETKVTHESTTPTHMLHSTINMINAPIDIQPHWSL